MPLVPSELEAVLARAVAAGDDALAVETLRALGRHQLVEGRAADSLRSLRGAAERAAHLVEASLGRPLCDLAGALSALGQPTLADQTYVIALAHLRRAGDHAGGADAALERVRSLVDAAPEVVEAAWAEVARRCAAAGRSDDELAARIAAARMASDRGDRVRAFEWLHDLAPRLEGAEGDDALWARGELALCLATLGQPT
ncbi:MAG: hypothetical protein WKG01_23685 [Kofleriaceae bacterium]